MNKIIVLLFTLLIVPQNVAGKWGFIKKPIQGIVQDVKLIGTYCSKKLTDCNEEECLKVQQAVNRMAWRLAGFAMISGVVVGVRLLLNVKETGEELNKKLEEAIQRLEKQQQEKQNFLNLADIETNCSKEFSNIKLLESKVNKFEQEVNDVMKSNDELSQQRSNIQQKIERFQKKMNRRLGHLTTIENQFRYLQKKEEKAQVIKEERNKLNKIKLILEKISKNIKKS